MLLEELNTAVDLKAETLISMVNRLLDKNVVVKLEMGCENGDVIGAELMTIGRQKKNDIDAPYEIHYQEQLPSGAYDRSVPFSWTSISTAELNAAALSKVDTGTYLLTIPWIDKHPKTNAKKRKK